MPTPASIPTSAVLHLSCCYRKALCGEPLWQRPTALTPWLMNCHLLCALPSTLAFGAWRGQRRLRRRLKYLEPCVHLDIYYSDRY